MRCLTIIMMFNLYPIKKLTIINNARAIFLMELKEKTFIDISSHIFDTIVDETRTTSKPKLIFPNLLMRISVRLLSEEDEGDEGKGDPMETEAKAVG